MKLEVLIMLAGMTFLGPSILAAEERDPITIDQLAPLLAKSAETSDFLSLAGDKHSQPIPISTWDRGIPLRSIVIPTNTDIGISFKGPTGDNYPLCYAKIPDARFLAKAKTLDQVLDTLLPPTKKNGKPCKHLRDINSVDVVAIQLASQAAFGHHINVVYFDQNRLIGIKCVLFYNWSETARTMASKIDRLSIECWFSADLSEWK